MLETGSIYETITPEETMTVADLLKELELEDRYFAVLVNGKKVGPDKVLSPQDEITILPYIAGGY
ncbi:MAG: hypothetical protein EU547_04415 [Promethearchaeota archaeon]|nr:MAG: hypothetical protein EU547_04415 [Candidatus Lokiarchaeota archaeon]